ncbi:methyltransferase domain-containing protein [Actinokineospora iranica]|uniref:Methyltransferase domain-containing protein n=1 Tax=Actinokineospora iranica TaxID=1271860 RepID=A0A1G6ISX2_9PSEU|nr:methyltransferase domain-containing protein [Actinokineospora iranica]SDC09530.1 Methyltransferase domain-containing protein [Actinokineospora iranica]
MTETREDPLDRAYREPVDLPGKTVELLTDVTGVVVDVGGDRRIGRRLRQSRPDLTVVAVDRARADVAGEACALPLRSGRAAAVLAPHLLRAVADIDAVLAEFARVLAPGGLVVVSANALGDLRELRALWWAAARDCGVVDPPPFLDADESFPLDHAQAWLSRHFGEVTVTPLRSTVAVPAEAALALVASSRPEETDVTWELLASIVERRVRDVVAAEGGFTLTTITGVATGVRAG